MTSAERAKLRSLAMNIEPTTHIGKNGVGDALIKQIDEQLDTRELIKIAVLRNADFSAKEIAEELALQSKSQVVQVLGSKITLYRVSKKDGVKHVL
ncbi:MAG: ribosome assembly RNA-binding protein YhbY [Clostridia bacterium]|nr:ribosome assembly RNA-binding protein YhbY [Clostridia bacterium]MDE6758377.1 ribosome assembly RNA-binding protein YhbY [Clostridia bacterium]MDE7079303.1 ribosome assembly RNA-binding protein YhbY [Clostridia bacterium]